MGPWKAMCQISELAKTTRYVRMMKRPVVPGNVLLESGGGAMPGGAMQRIIRELCGPAYGEYCLFLAVSRENRTAAARALMGCGGRLRIVEYGSAAHLRLLATAGYLLTDTFFSGRFVRRRGQVCVSIRLGELPDRMGREIDGEAHAIGSIQSSLLASDYILCAGTGAKKRLEAAYDLSGLFAGTYLFSEDPGRVCRRIFLAERDTDVRAERAAADDRRKLLFYVGGLKRNGITTALLNLLEHLGPEEFCCFAAFQEEYLAEDPSRLGKLPEYMGLIPVTPGWYMTAAEAAACFFYYKCGRDWPVIRRYRERFYRREYRRNFGGAVFDWSIHFTGYERKMTGLLQEAPCRRMIFVHNDMLMEVRSKGNHHLPTLLDAYRSYDCVAAVSRDILEQTAKLAQDRSRLHVVSNCHDYRGVLARAGEELVFDSTTRCTVSLEELKNRLAQPNVRKMINIGRYSREKGHDLLLEAFAEYVRERPDSLLVIIGGEGDLYEETRESVKRLGLSDRVILLRSIANPMPILKACDLFVLSSRYEGLGLVILEADTLGVPVISTDVVGPHGFMKEHGGCLVSPDSAGILGGMRAFDRGEVPVMGVDYEAFNRKAVDEFLKLVK